MEIPGKEMSHEIELWDKKFPQIVGHTLNLEKFILQINLSCKTGKAFC